MSVITLFSTVTCPVCGYQKKVLMPEHACTLFYVCQGCGERLEFNPGDCCVYCSYGDIPCPPSRCDMYSKETSAAH